MITPEARAAGEGIAGGKEAAIDLGPEARRFRDEVRGWLEANRPAEPIDGDPERIAFGGVPGLEDWTRKLHAAGFMCVAWPKEYGGRGLSGVEVAVLNEEFARAGVPRITRGMGEWLVGRFFASGYAFACGSGLRRDQPSRSMLRVDGSSTPVLIRVALGPTAAMHRRDPPRCHTSGPMMTSTSPSTTPCVSWSTGRARRRGCSIGSALPSSRRTGHELQRAHNGGATRPRRPPSARLNHAGGPSRRRRHSRRQINARKLGRERDPLVRQQLAWAHTHVEIMRYQGLRTLSEVVAKKEPGPASALNKMFWSEYAQRFAEIVMDIRGADSMVMPGGSTGDGRYEPDRWQRSFLSTRSVTIWGGTAQVQRNIVGERVLGLPKEPGKEDGRR